MRSPRGVWCSLAVCCSVAVLPAQQPAEVSAELRALRFAAAPSTDAAAFHAQQRRRGEALHARLRQDWRQYDNVALAAAAVDLWYLLGRTSTQAEIEALLDELEAWLRQRPGTHDGWSLLLRQRSRSAKDAGRATDLAARWRELWQSFSGPKRHWIGIEAGRALITVLDQPALADELLTQALVELAQQPEWGETERLALARDLDLYLTLPERPRAATWRETRGQLLLLRGYAREQIGHLLPAVGDLMEARAAFTWSDNRHRLTNCDHNLASVWLHLGKLDQAMRTAEDAERRYREPIRFLPWEPEVVDDYGILAMQKVRAQALLRRGGAGDLARAEQVFAAMVTDEFLAWPGETNVDALVSYAELVLRLPPTLERAGTIERLVDRLYRFCGDNHEQLLFLRVRLVDARRALRRGDLAAARQSLEQLEGPLARHRHLPLQVQRLLLLAQVEHAAGAATAAMDACVVASDLVQHGLVREQLWRLEGVSAAYLGQFGEVLAVAKAACDLGRDEAGDAAASLLQRLHLVVQRFHGAVATCRLRTAGDARSTALAPDEQGRLLQLRAEVDRLRGRHGWIVRQPPRHPLARRQRDLDLARLEAELEHAEAALAAFEVEQRLAVPSPAVSASSVADLRSVLRPGELLVECVEVAGAAFAFVITQAGIEQHPLPSGADWSAAVLAVREWASARDRTLDAAQVPALARAASLLLPEGGWFDAMLRRPDIDTLLWSPEGSFARLPVAALPWQGAPLVASRAVAHVVSANLLVETRRRAATNGPLCLLALGNPRYPAGAVHELVERSQMDGSGFASLPGSAGEVIAIAREFASDAERRQLDAVVDPVHFDGELSGQRFRVLLGAAAQEQALTEAALRGVQVLHLACHGEVNAEVPAMSFLALSLTPGGPDQGDDGLLRLSELCGLRGDFELVVLSACTSAVGAAHAHDGVGGLAWAAQVAGARRVLATLWRLPDAVACDVAVAFHRRWLANRGAAAMDLATIQREAIGRLPVSDWAAFVLWGEPR